MRQKLILSLVALAGLATPMGCASLAGVKERYTVCPYDQVWDAALETVKDRAVSAKDKDHGMIQTAWLEVPMEGRTYGAFQREIKDSRDRSRVSIYLRRLNDVTIVSLAEERERWAFRGGSRLFGWAPTDPSEEVMKTLQTRLDGKLKERGCTST
jgi:hypothetical protein